MPTMKVAVIWHTGLSVKRVSQAALQIGKIMAETGGSGNENEDDFEAGS